MNFAAKHPAGAMIFVTRASAPLSLGAVGFLDNIRVVSIDEKPVSPKSRHAHPGVGP